MQSCLTAETDLLLLLIEYKLLNNFIKGKKILVIFFAVSCLCSLGDDRGNRILLTLSSCGGLFH